MEEIPCIGMGTRGLEGDGCYQSIRDGLAVGYRHIDTASHYHNEEKIGEAVKDSQIPREKLWITSKLWIDDFSRVQEACEESLQRLQIEYLDLFLIHWPSSESKQNEAVFEQLLLLQKQGKIKKIGVSNFTISQIQSLISLFGEEIFANEIEFHSCLSQEKMLSFAQEHHFHIIAYSPFGHGHLFQLSALQILAQKTGYSLSQLCLSRLLQQGVVVIPKATSRERLQANFQALQCSLSDEILQEIDLLPKYYRYLNPPFAPQWD